MIVMLWIIVMRDRFRKENRAVIPLIFGEELCKQLLSCAESSLGNNGFQKPGAAAANGKTTNADSGPKVFDLSKLNPMEIKNEQFNFQLIIESVAPGSAAEQVSEQSRRWISTSPLIKTDFQTQDGALPKFDPSQQWLPWNDPSSIEIYEPLIPDLIGFLMDAAIRYRNIDTPPVVNALYSMSGDRRFYFDLRNTRWGHRLFLSQVTDLHRNVIAIPVEALTDFRDRINTFIEKLRLEEGKDLRDALQVHSAPQRYWKPYPKMRQNMFNGAAFAPPPRAPFMEGPPVPAEASVTAGFSVGTFTAPTTNVRRTRQISSSKGCSKSRTRTISRTSTGAGAASATADAGPHRTRQISTSSKGASRPGRQFNNVQQPKDGTHRRQTPNKQQPQQAPKDRTPNSNAQQVGGAPARSKDRSDQQTNDVQPKPAQSRPQQHWQQRPRKPNANNRSATGQQQQSGVEGAGPASRSKPFTTKNNSSGEAPQQPKIMPQSAAPKQQQQHNRNQAGPIAWNQTAQRATAHEVSEVQATADAPAADAGRPGQTGPQQQQDPAAPVEQKQAQQGQQRRPHGAPGGSRPAKQRPVPPPTAAAAAAAAAPVDSSPKVEQAQQQQHAPKPASNGPRSQHSGAQQTQGQTTPQQPRRQQLPTQELEAPNVASTEEGEEEKVEKEAAAKETTAASAEQASVETNAATTGRKTGRKTKSRKKRPGDAGQGESEQNKEENGKVEDNSQEPAIAV